MKYYQLLRKHTPPFSSLNFSARGLLQAVHLQNRFLSINSERYNFSKRGMQMICLFIHLLISADWTCSDTCVPSQNGGVNLFAYFHKGTFLNWFLQRRKEPIKWVVVVLSRPSLKGWKKFITMIIIIIITTTTTIAVNGYSVKLHI